MKPKAVIFDWAGTVVDYGCQAPVVVLDRIFAAAGVPLEGTESRHAMGLLKKDQIREICRLPRVASAWQAKFGAPPDEAAIERLFADFVPTQLACIEEYSNVIEGVPAIVASLRGKGARIGGTTGYTRPMLDLVIPKAQAQGYAPDFAITPTETAGLGRPLPWMIFEVMRRLDVYPPAAVVKVGDTPSDMQEARNAGVWAIGVVASSNEAAAFGPEVARQRLEQAGAHRVIDTLAELEQAMETLG
jgi:phosphonoacetaldehyde hydrolase